MAFLYFPALVILCLFAIVLRAESHWARSVYRTALLLVTAPYGLHVAYNLRYAGMSATEPLGNHSMWAYMSMSVVAMLALLAGAMMLVRRLPIATALLPAALWPVYWFVCLPFAYQGTPLEVLPPDNVPNVWLFASSAFGLFALATTAMAAKNGLRGQSPPNPPLQRAGFARH